MRIYWPRGAVRIAPTHLGVVMEKAILAKYCNQMVDVRRRTEVVKCFVSGTCHAKYDVSTAECIALQIRKILELIALASLVANKDEYRKQHANFALHWQAKLILARVAAVNPKFYPVPKIPMDLPNGTLDFQDGVKGYLTLDNFKTLYDKCSKLIHSRNPFSTQNPDEAVQFLNSVVGWINKIIVLLNHHLIYLSLEDEFICRADAQQVYRTTPRCSLSSS